MSCATQTQQPVRFIVSMGALPEGFCGTPQELAQAIADRLIINANPFTSSFAIGSVAPTSNIGPWLKDCETWYVWSDATGSYVPMQFPAFASVGSGTILAWAGSIATIPDGYLFCDGTEVAVADYPLLFNVIGDTYGAPTCPGLAFVLPDMRNRFIVGADADVAGVAMSTVTGAALKTGGSTTGAHTHTGSITPNTANNEDGGDPESARAETWSFTTSSSGPQIIPPFIAHPWIIKT